MAEQANVVYPYVPNTAPINKEAMKKEIGIVDDMELYRDIPDNLIYKERLQIPEAMGDEYTVRRYMKNLFKKNIDTEEYLNFLGAGCQKHYAPVVCDTMVSRGEFLTSYLCFEDGPHGQYQALWEYQAQMSELLDVDFIGFPQYDGAIALAHAIVISTRTTERKKVLLPASISPTSLGVTETWTDGVTERYADIEKVAYDEKTGLLDLDDLKAKLDDSVAAVVIENPTFLGVIETQAEEIGKLAKAAGAEFIVYCDPLSLGVMEAPANYGATITVGDIHNLGCHVAAGGMQGGFVGFSCKDDRYLTMYKDLALSIVPTIADGEYGFTFWNFEGSSYGLREEAHEFTGTGSNLWGIYVAVYLTLMGPQGMKEIGETNMKRAQYGAKKLAEIPGVSVKFDGFYNEVVVDFSGTGMTVAQINKALLDKEIFGGFDLGKWFPELDGCALYCFTEVTTQADIDTLCAAVRSILA